MKKCFVFEHEFSLSLQILLASTDIANVIRRMSLVALWHQYPVWNIDVGLIVEKIHPLQDLGQLSHIGNEKFN